MKKDTWINYPVNLINKTQYKLLKVTLKYYLGVILNHSKDKNLSIKENYLIYLVVSIRFKIESMIVFILNYCI